MKWFDKLICGLFGHDWKEFITGVTENIEDYFKIAGKRCERCGKEIKYETKPPWGRVVEGEL